VQIAANIAKTVGAISEARQFLSPQQRGRHSLARTPPLRRRPGPANIAKLPELLRQRSPDADGERLKENPRRYRRRGVRSENYDEAHTSYRQWRLAIKPILWVGVTSDCARRLFPPPRSAEGQDEYAGNGPPPTSTN